MQPSTATQRLGTLAIAVLLASACSGDRTGTPKPDTPAQSADAPVAGDPATGSVTPPPVATVLDQYAREASALATALAAGAETELLKSRAEGLIDRAAGIVPAFVKLHPHCASYLEAALQVRERWPDLDHDAIERDYHHDGALPKIDNAGFCYHMKDLVTHPATVLVLLSQAEPDFVQAKAEIDEVIAHIGVVRGQF
jgi:hypothetical protein